VGSGTDSAPLLGAPVVREAMQETEKVLARAQFGAEFNTEKPFREGGLISSADGLLWVPSA
jgi:halogenation protein CepH